MRWWGWLLLVLAFLMAAGAYEKADRLESERHQNYRMPFSYP